MVDTSIEFLPPNLFPELLELVSGKRGKLSEELDGDDFWDTLDFEAYEAKLQEIVVKDRDIDREEVLVGAPNSWLGYRVDREDDYVTQTIAFGPLSLQRSWIANGNRHYGTWDICEAGKLEGSWDKLPKEHYECLLETMHNILEKCDPPSDWGFD